MAMKVNLSFFLLFHFPSIFFPLKKKDKKNLGWKQFFFLEINRKYNFLKMKKVLNKLKEN